MIADRVKDTSTTTGTGNFTLSGTAPTGYQALAAIGSTGTTFGYVIDNGAEWEVGIGTITAANTFSRAPSASSNGGSLVNFSAGTKSVFHTVTAAQFNQIAGANDIAFSTTVPLLNASGTYMTGVQSVTGALTFTPAANAVRGAYTFAYLKANGTNIPDVSAFTEHGGSMGYLNTANILNIAEFFNLAGVNWISWSQAAVPVAVTTPTTVTLTGPTSGVINTATSNYTVGTDGTRSSSVTVTPTPVTGVTFTPSSVTLSAGTGTATFTATSTSTGSKTIAVTNNASLTNPASITLTVAAAATAPATMSAPVATLGDTTASIAYTAPADGGNAITGYTVTPYIGATAQAAQTFGSGAGPVTVTGLTNGTAYTFKIHANNGVGPGPDSPASNSVTPAAAVATTIRMTGTKTGDVTESTGAPWTYTSAGGATGSTGVMGGLTLPINANGEVVFKVNTNSADFAVRVGQNSTIQAIGSGDQFLWSNGANNYKTFGNSSNVSAYPHATGDLIRFQVTGGANADFLVDYNWSISKDNGATWSLIEANTPGTNGGRKGPYFIQLIPGSNAVLSVVSVVGFA